jgi:hypothetical protein
MFDTLFQAETSGGRRQSVVRESASTAMFITSALVSLEATSLPVTVRRSPLRALPRRMPRWKRSSRNGPPRTARGTLACVTSVRVVRDTTSR